jgi:hypothetical protein
MSERQQLERIMEIDRRMIQWEYPNADRMAVTDIYSEIQ